MDADVNGDGDFSLVLLQRRCELGLTQEVLAEQTGLSVRAISDIERGRTSRPRRSSIQLLAAALGIDELIDDKLVDDAVPKADQLSRAIAPPDLVVPRQLPPMTSQFVGRVAEFDALTELLGRAGDGASAVAGISGIAGVGKTALAVRWAHQMANHFPDGQLYQDLRGFGPADPVAAADALCGFLEALRVPPARIPAQAGARAGLFRSLLADKRMLVLLDNAANADHVRSLLPGSPGCLTLVTSRNLLTGLAVAVGADLVRLEVLSEAEAHDLLSLRLGAERLAEDPGAARELVELTAGLPLALSIAAARATAHRSYPLSVLAAELRDSRGRLEALAGGDPSADVRAAISWSYRRLSDEAARMFRLLGSHPGRDLTVAAAASLSGCLRAQARQALAELAAEGLVTERVPGRFGCHDLLTVYATELSAQVDDAVTRRAATGRLLDHYVLTANTAMLLIYPVSEPLPLPPPTAGVRPEELHTKPQAAAWLGAERDVLLAALAEAVRAGFDHHAWVLPPIMGPYLHRSGRWHDWAASHRTALAAAARLGDEYAQARVHCRLGLALACLGEYDDAAASLRWALRAHCRTADLVGMASTHAAIAMFLEMQDRYRDSLNHAKRALTLFRRAGNRLGEALALNDVGWAQVRLGDYEQAMIPCQQALAVCAEIGDNSVTAGTWNSLGMVHLRLGQPARAIGCYEQAIADYRQVGHRAGEADSLESLGDAQHACGDSAGAAGSWRQAMTIYLDLLHPGADTVRAKLTGVG